MDDTAKEAYLHLRGTPTAARWSSSASRFPALLSVFAGFTDRRKVVRLCFVPQEPTEGTHDKNEKAVQTE